MSYQYAQFESLAGPRLTLTRIDHSDIPELARELISPTTWFSQTWGYRDEASFRAGMENLLEQQGAGKALNLKATYEGQIVAMSRYHSATPDFTRVEIGFTWIANQWQRTFVNTELKLLMLGYAFDVIAVKRVEFCVHPKNTKSNAAMIRIGAKLEGTLRSYRFRPTNPDDDGDRNMYSIIASEWASINAELSRRRR